MDNRHQVGPEMAGSGALGHQDGSGTAVSGALGRQVGPGTAVSEALGRQVGSGTAVLGALGHLDRPQGHPGVQKRTSNGAGMDAVGAKIDAKWALEAQKKTNFVTEVPKESVSECFFNRFLEFL